MATSHSELPTGRHETTLLAYYTNSNPAQLSAIASDGSSPVRIEYLNEGGANFVFRFLTEIDTGETKVSGKLLRLRKDNAQAQTTSELLRSLDEDFKPLFPDRHLVQHDPISLHGDLARTLNEMILRLDRIAERKDDFLDIKEPFGLLITDMTPPAGGELLQLKPKWLVQSPNAPSEAKRCRTCALRAQRACKGTVTATDEQRSCPLDLLSDREDDRRAVAQKLTLNHDLVEWLTTASPPLLSTLRKQQQQLDPKGVLQVRGDQEIYGLCKAMTLRDCTLFVRGTEGDVEARLGDLDSKQPEKLGRWKEVERRLIEDGWYANAEDESTWVKESVCRLSR